MKKLHDGGPAFTNQAEIHTNGDVINYVATGMSLRDWFAGMALAHMALPQCIQDADSADDAAGMAYEYADAMLKARSE